MNTLKIAREVVYVETIPTNGLFFLAGDIGGTNSNFGVFYLSDKKPVLLFSLHLKSKTIENFTTACVELLEYIRVRYAIQPTHGCFGVAGITYGNRRFVKPTNLSFTIDAYELEKVTTIKNLFLINDFEAVPLGLDLIDQRDIIYLQQGTAVNHAHKGFLGAGTGLGKSIALWDLNDKRYIPIASEGGHTDAVAYTQQELDIFEYIKNERNSRYPISWENILSGHGIQSLYTYLGSKKEYAITQATEEIERMDFNPDRISYYAKIDERCKDTFAYYVTFYARCAKNFALESLSLGGLYIAGGIAAKNISLFFDARFLKEFTFSDRHHNYLNQMPIAIIADYNISLYGAVVAANYHTSNVL